MNRQSLIQYNMYVRCPVCNETNIEPADFMNHIMMEHPYFFVVWASLNMPWMHTQDILSDDYDDTMSYEYLSNLCEVIGNHTVGIEDINTVTTIVYPEKDVVTCPICLDDIAQGGVCRKINVCSHQFCNSCISKWLTAKKTCPVCIQHVEEDNDQIVSTSISSSLP